MSQNFVDALTRLQKKERLWTNNDVKNAKYENIDPQTKKTCNRGTAFELSVEQLLGWGIKSILLARNLTLIGMQLQIKCSVCKGVIYLICETSRGNTYNHKKKQSKGFNVGLTPEQEKNTNKPTVCPVWILTLRSAAVQLSTLLSVLFLLSSSLVVMPPTITL